MTHQQAEEAIKAVCQYLENLHAISPKKTEDAYPEGVDPWEVTLIDGESQAAPVARQMARDLLESAGCDGLGGCRLCLN